MQSAMSTAEQFRDETHRQWFGVAWATTSVIFSTFRRPEHALSKRSSSMAQTLACNGNPGLLRLEQNTFSRIFRRQQFQGCMSAVLWVQPPIVYIRARASSNFCRATLRPQTPRGPIFGTLALFPFTIPALTRSPDDHWFNYSNCIQGAWTMYQSICISIYRPVCRSIYLCSQTKLDLYVNVIWISFVLYLV